MIRTLWIIRMLMYEKDEMKRIETSANNKFNSSSAQSCLHFGMLHGSFNTSAYARVLAMSKSPKCDWQTKQISSPV